MIFKNNNFNIMKKKSKSVLIYFLLNILFSTFVGAQKTTIIGHQEWMAENLSVDKFRNGDPIPQAKTNKEWSDAGFNSKPAWCYYKNSDKNGVTYGKLYNWYAITDPRGIAPAGWHVPNNDDWDTLVAYLSSNAGLKIKSTTGWKKNGNGTDVSGFTGLPGGGRDGMGRFKTLGTWAGWWSISEEANFAWCYMVNDFSYNLRKDYLNKERGWYVRCIKD